MKKAEDFSEWYNEAIDNAGLIDKRYPVKGMNVWTPYGLRIMRLMTGLMHEEMARTGHDEVQFPVLIPEDQFQREADHIKGFEENVYWVTHGGLNPLDVRLILRPTSETAMYSLFSLWIRSHTDLPLKTYQIVPVFRYETKQTRTFLRVRELSFFFESHTVHSDFEDAERQIREDLEIWDRLAEAYALPALLLKRPDWDKFPGAHYTVAADAYVAAAGRALQVAGIHQYRDNFAQVYDITYEDEDGAHRNGHQTTYGMSERLLGAVVALHGDDQGMVLPPAIAPVQVVVVPILAKGEQERVAEAAQALREELEGAARAELDLRDLRPGAKFYEWERRGVPLRAELGTVEIEGGTVTLVRRDTGERRTVERKGIAAEVQAVLRTIQTDLRHRAEEGLSAHTEDVTSYDAAPASGLLRVGWCGKASCGHAMEEALDRHVLGTPYRGEAFSGSCLECGEATQTVAYVAKTF